MIVMLVKYLFVY